MEEGKKSIEDFTKELKALPEKEREEKVVGMIESLGFDTTESFALLTSEKISETAKGLMVMGRFKPTFLFLLLEWISMEYPEIFGTFVANGIGKFMEATKIVDEAKTKSGLDS